MTTIAFCGRLLTSVNLLFDTAIRNAAFYSYPAAGLKLRLLGPAWVLCPLPRTGKRASGSGGETWTGTHQAKLNITSIWLWRFLTLAIATPPSLSTREMEGRSQGNRQPTRPSAIRLFASPNFPKRSRRLTRVFFYPATEYGPQTRPCSSEVPVGMEWPPLAAYQRLRLWLPRRSSYPSKADVVSGEPLKDRLPWASSSTVVYLSLWATWSRMVPTKCGDEGTILFTHPYLFNCLSGKEGRRPESPRIDEVVTSFVGSRTATYGHSYHVFRQHVSNCELICEQDLNECHPLTSGFPKHQASAFPSTEVPVRSSFFQHTQDRNCDGKTIRHHPNLLVHVIFQKKTSTHTPSNPRSSNVLLLKRARGITPSHMPNETPGFLFQSLPSELQREIFLLAAANDPKNLIQLVLVARRVNTWVQPCIYRLVSLGEIDADLFLWVMDRKPDSFFSANVKQLCLTASLRVHQARRVLAACTGVVNLALWVDFLGRSKLPQGSVAPLVSTLPLRRLSIEYKHLIDVHAFPTHSPPVWYRTLTHLDIIFWAFEAKVSFAILEDLICLTHLSLDARDCKIDENHLATILATSPWLRILLILQDELADPDIFPEVNDARIIYTTYPLSIVRDWEGYWTGAPNVWSQAEEESSRRMEEAKKASAVSPAQQALPT